MARFEGPHHTVVRTRTGILFADADMFVPVRRDGVGVRSASRFIPIHKAARYLAFESSWGRRRVPKKAGWAIIVADRLRAALAEGEVAAKGVPATGHKVKELEWVDIPPAFWSAAVWLRVQNLESQMVFHEAEDPSAGVSTKFSYILVNAEEISMLPARAGIFSLISFKRRLTASGLDNVIFRSQDQLYKVMLKRMNSLSDNFKIDNYN